jgi:F0F1-type ATP synthase delta subunit
MTKKQLQKLLSQSYSNAVLDRNKTSLIAGQLKRSELKQFIKALRLNENANNVYVTLPSKPDTNFSDNIHSLFPNKKVLYDINPSINPGIRITVGDLLYEVSLRDRIQKIITYIEQSYD